jgi:hypothetical protein
VLDPVFSFMRWIALIVVAGSKLRGDLEENAVIAVLLPLHG